MGADKNSSRRRSRLQQDEHGFNTRLRLTTQVGQAHTATEVLLDLGTNQQPSEPRHTNTHNGNLHGLLPVLHRSDRWPAPVRPMDSASQAGGYSSHTRSVPESLSDFSRPWNKNTTQSLSKQPQTDQELTSSTTAQRHTSPAVHPRQVPLVVCTGQTVKSTGQTGVTWAAWDEQHPRVNSPKSKP
jgi:hypothetical protein